MNEDLIHAASPDSELQAWPPAGSGISWTELGAPIAKGWRGVLSASVITGVLGVAASYCIAPTFLSVTTFLPPQQQQNSASSALASIGALAGLAGVSATKSPADEYVGLMQSVTVADRIIDHFQLLIVYGAKFRDEARRELAKRSQISVGKKDGMISVQVEDTDPKRAAEIANQYVEELRRMTSVLAVSEAQQRRVFFENQLQEVGRKLVAAQTALTRSGFDEGSLKAEPKATADTYARMRAELTATEVSLQTLRSSLADTAPEIRQKIATRNALQAQLADIEHNRASPTGASGSDFIDKYREFKYQETLSEIMSRQYEVARLDEAREGALVQVVDVAKAAEHKAAPKRIYMGVGAAIAGFVGYAVFAVIAARRQVRRARPN
ncbi:MAG: lipopolysaccharide biosynthesis protein [Burkholderiaceae bacterium]